MEKDSNMRIRRLSFGLNLVTLSFVNGALGLLAGCEPMTYEPLPSPSAAAASASPSSKPTPTPTPLPAPVFSAIPDAYKNISGWTGSLKVTLEHSHSAPNYSYQESYSADGLVSIFDSSTQGSFYRWPLPSTGESWKADITASSLLDDGQNSQNVVHQSCRYTGKFNSDVSLSLIGGSYRLTGNLGAVDANCEGSPNQRQLPGLAIVANRRYWEFTYPLPAAGTRLSGSYSFVLDGKNLSFSWDLTPFFEH